MLDPTRPDPTRPDPTRPGQDPAELVHLATRTCYSLRDGVIRPRELARAAAQMGMPAVGIADRGGLYGGVRFTQACAAEGVRPIYGADLALHPDLDPVSRAERRPGWGISRSSAGGIGRTMGPGSGQAWLEDDAPRITLIAADAHGFATLNRTISEHHMTADRGDPHLTWEAAVRRLSSTSGVLVLLDDQSPVGRLLGQGRLDAARVEARRWLEVVGPDRLLVGVTHHLAPGDDARARKAFGLADELGLRAVAHQAARYLTPDQARIADVMDAVRQQVPLARHHASRRNAEGFFKSPSAMARVFAERPDALANTMWVADRCHVDMGLGRLRVPDFVSADQHDLQRPEDRAAWAQAELRRRCEAGLRQRFDPDEADDPGGPLQQLLEREMAMVRQLGLAPYFLTVGEIMGRIRDKGILAACRGSAASSLITYALRISDVDPIAHDLAFERFMNPYRDELPDIDIDVESARREEIYRDLLDTYGTDRVACVCMVETFKARMAIREVGKAIGLPAGEIDVIAKSFPHVRAGDVRAALAHLPELQGTNLDSGHLALLFDVVERMDGFPRHIALHPSGVLLADDTLPDLVPMERSAAGFAMAQYDKDDVEALGLCKLDVLAIRMLSSMSHAIEEASRIRDVDLDFDTVGWADSDTYELIRSTRTLGMFQIESPGQRELIGKFQPEHHGDLVVDISLFRPGPVKGDMIKPFLKRRHATAGPSGVPHPLLDRALGETYGVIVYHEQVMRCVAAVTGCDLAEADLVRRRLGDPDEVGKLERWIKRGARKRGVPTEVADWLWTALSQFASFGFCKAHAAAFSVPTYRSAWLKAHFLPEFMAGVLTHDPGMYPRRLILDDARQFGVAVLPLDVNASPRDYRVEVIEEDHAWDLLGVDIATGRLPRGWRWEADRPLPAAGFDKGQVRSSESGRVVPGWRYGIRLALQDVERIDDAMIDSLLANRPFTSVEDLRVRARLSQPVVESLAHAGALDGIGGVGTLVPSQSHDRGLAHPEVPNPQIPAISPRSELHDRGLAHPEVPNPQIPAIQSPLRVRTRRDLLLEVAERWSGLKRHRAKRAEEPVQLGLLPLEPSPGLAEYRESERVRAEMEVVGMDASRHVISFYDGLMDVLGVTRAGHLLDCDDGTRVRIAGVKVATQTPPVKSGQRVIFLSLDDATGIGDAAFFESVHDRCSWTVFHSWLLVAEGKVHRSGRRGVSVTADRAWDLRRLMVAWREGWLDEALAEQGRPKAPAPATTVQNPDTARPAATAGSTDGAPSEAIRGAAGRSGLVLPGREREHLQMVRTVPFDGALAAAASARPTPTGPATGDGVPGAPSRVGPNGATWADPAGRHPGVDGQDVSRLSPNDPRHPDHPSQSGEPPKKLWHSSPGSSGR